MSDSVDKIIYSVTKINNSVAKIIYSVQKKHQSVSINYSICKMSLIIWKAK